MNGSWLLLFALSIFLPIAASAGQPQQAKRVYALNSDPLDVVIVSHPKDRETLDDCIRGIKENCVNVGRVVVVSAKRLTHEADWFDEKDYPFSLGEVITTIARGDKKKIEAFVKFNGRGPGWYFQQLLKLYAPFAIPGLSSNVLVVDADTIFLNPTQFQNERGGPLFCVVHGEGDPGYFAHAKRLVPGYRRIYPEFYSVCHHMIFQRSILKDLFELVEKAHKAPFWKAFCLCVDLHQSGASEYEIYFNFALRRTKQAAIRELTWTNASHLDEKELFKQAGYHFVSFHTYMRDKWPRKFD